MTHFKNTVANGCMTSSEYVETVSSSGVQTLSIWEHILVTHIIAAAIFDGS